MKDVYFPEVAGVQFHFFIGFLRNLYFKEMLPRKIFIYLYLTSCLLMKQHRVGLSVWLLISTVGVSTLFIAVMGH